MIPILSVAQTIAHAMVDAAFAGAALFAVVLLLNQLPQIGAGLRYRCWSAVAIFPLIAFTFVMASAVFFDSPGAPVPLRVTTPLVDPFDLPLQRAAQPIVDRASVSAARRQQIISGSPTVASFEMLTSWVLLGLALWILVGLTMLGRTLALMIGAQLLLAEAKDGQISTSESESAQVPIKLSDRVSGPIAIGVLTRAVLFPRHWSTAMSRADVRSICAHEVAHLVRCDDRWNLIERIACAVMWPNPLVHLAARLARGWRERACDDWAAARTGARPFVEALIKSADTIASRVPQGTLPFIGGGDLVGRVEAVLHPRPASRRASGLAGTLLGLSFLLAVAAVVAHAAPFTGPDIRIVETGAMHDARANFAAAKLHSGDVLVAGGMKSPTSFLASAEVYDARAGRFVQAGALPEAIAGAVATVLSDGRVLLTGGRTTNGPTADAEIFDPQLRAFQRVPPLGFARVDHTATLLKDGHVLLTGGRGANGVPVREAELFDPASHTFAPAGIMRVARWGHTATLLRNGDVLVAGGLQRAESLRSTEIYEPALDRFTPGPQMVQARSRHGAIALSDGSVLLLGGSRSYAWTGALRSAERYDPARNRFARVGDMAVTRLTLANTLVRLPNDNVMIAGGSDRVEVYNRRTRRFTVLSGSLGRLRSGDAAIELDTCALLVIGGYDMSEGQATAMNTSVRIE